MTVPKTYSSFGPTGASYNINNRRTALYRHYDAEGRLLYVGVTFNPGHRASGHRAYAEWIDQATTFTGTWFPTRAEALAAEKEAIRAEKPIYNRQRYGAGAAPAPTTPSDPDTPRTVNFLLEQESVDELESLADELDTTRSEVVRTMLEFSINNWEPGWRP
ncbi:hypothetical protein [Micromonospora carbonacea]|uniref:GIY-YIG catalytic domain n=1 Tax=Micromonospora carbonacea TaxID=47853 RepID=A0A1C5AC89_9ACTN|nr:hypothetical protein [Micromonospora carbonacea]SCF42858.1 GIY-YIG catalytic domain [Micromonospora carbonacea]